MELDRRRRADGFSILTEAVRLYGAESPEDLSQFGTLIDYLTWLTLDALPDEALARQLAATYAKLGADLHSVEVLHRDHLQDTAAQACLAGQLISMILLLNQYPNPNEPANPMAFEDTSGGFTVLYPGQVMEFVLDHVTEVNTIQLRNNH